MMIRLVIGRMCSVLGNGYTKHDILAVKINDYAYYRWMKLSKF
jgi:hypothetical protein